MRSMWKGAISFGLVSIPIKLYTATEDHAIHFRQLHKECKSPIKYEKICPVCNRPVSDEEIVRGYEYEPGKFVIIDDEDLERIPMPTVKTIDIVDFTDIGQIDPIYYDKTYFIVPEDIGTKPYVLLRDSMKETKRVAIAKVVIRSKQNLACIRVYDEKYMVMETMHFPDEIKNTNQLPPLREVNLQENEIKMAKQLIDTLTSDFKPEKYDDSYRKALIEMIESKIQNKDVEIPQKAPEADNVLDLVSALKASIESVKKEEKAKKRAQKKRRIKGRLNMSMIEEKISPMLASSSDPFDSPEWIYEVKWDGSRTIAFISNKTRLQDRRLVDITYQFPDLALLHKQIKAKEAILDGELVVLKNGKPSYKSIMSRKHQQNLVKINLLSKIMPVIFITWDILYLNGKSLVELPLIVRKDILRKTVKENEVIKISDFIFEHGKMLFEETGKKGLEGIVAKKADSKYLIGKRSKLWLKSKHFIVINAVIIGYRTDKTALILGLYDEENNLINIGSCESGLSQKELKAFYEVAKEIKAPDNYYNFKEKNVQWLEPLLTCKVRFMEWSENMKMRAPSFIQFEYNVKPEECKFE